MGRSLRRRFAADTPLRDTPEQGIGVAVPAPINDRLDGLVDLLIEEGERTSRKELIAAIIFATPGATEGLTETLRRYRRAIAREALLEPENASGSIPVTVRKPGPRSKRS